MKADFGDQVSYRTGATLLGLEKLVNEHQQFDFFFIDADKENYLDYCIRLADTGALIVTDNVLAGGSVADEDIKPKPKRYTEIMKKFNVAVANHPQLESLLIPIGDGLTISRVKK